MYISPLIFILIAIAAALGFEAGRNLIRANFSSDQARTARRLKTLAARIQNPNETSDEESLLRAEADGSAIDRLVEKLPGAGRIQLDLYRAGLTVPLKRFLLLTVALMAVGFVALSVFSTNEVMRLAGAGLGLLPWINARRLAAKRTTAFEQQFPDALDLLIRALRAGHSLSVGLQMVADELPDPVGSEFGFVADEIQLGKPVPQALANLAHRVDAPDLPFFVVAVTIQQETGSNLAEVLQNLSEVVRERFKLYGKVRALTAMGRASANLLACWPAVMVGSLYVVNQDYIRPLWETEEGHTMMMIAAVMIVFGYVVCRRMATIKV
ncbi:MAG: type II secretion system F family protein [Deltaproteobacteria bacterium]|jgi:tight adherence protein B|nr:type II secretion system F family protein [Deltaproteobacteria bacterium]